jgi:hypothetical protein
MFFDRRNVNRLTVDASPWLDMLVTVYYWTAFIVAEARRYHKPTGKRHPRYRERRVPILTIPWKTHYLGITAVVFTWTLAIMYYRPHGEATTIGFTATLLIVYMFFALWNGPMLQTVSTIEGVGQIAVAANLTLYLTVHTWRPAWLTLMDFTFGVIVATIVACTLMQLIRRSCERSSAQQLPPPSNR